MWKYCHKVSREIRNAFKVPALMWSDIIWNRLRFILSVYYNSMAPLREKEKKICANKGESLHWKSKRVSEKNIYFCFINFIVSNSSWPYELQQASLRCPSPTHLVMPSNHLILCHSLLLPPSIFPSIRVFSIESVLLITWPEY